MIGFSVVACSRASTPAPAVGPYTAQYFGGFRPLTSRDCDGSLLGASRLDQAVPVELFHAPFYGSNALRDQTLPLAAYYDRYGVFFSVDASAEVTSFDYLFDASNDSLNTALRQAGVTDKQSAAGQAVVRDELLGAMRKFLHDRHARGARGVQIVMLRAISSPRLEAMAGKSDMTAGMGLSPELFRQFMSEPGRADEDPFASFGLDADFPPALFVAAEKIHLYLTDPTAVVSHEMGHALGLVHAMTDGNLMYPTVSTSQTCVPVLSTEQLSELRTGVAAAKPAREATEPDHVDDYVQRLVRDAIGGLSHDAL